YGSAAMGGVVNVITKTPSSDALQADVSLTGGTQRRREGVGDLSFGVGPVASAVDVSRRTTGTAPGWADDGGALSDRTDLGATVRLTPTAGRSLELGTLGVDERQRWRSGSV